MRRVARSPGAGERPVTIPRAPSQPPVPGAAGTRPPLPAPSARTAWLALTALALTASGCLREGLMLGPGCADAGPSEAGSGAAASAQADAGLAAAGAPGADGGLGSRPRERAIPQVDGVTASGLSLDPAGRVHRAAPPACLTDDGPPRCDLTAADPGWAFSSCHANLGCTQGGQRSCLRRGESCHCQPTACWQDRDCEAGFACLCAGGLPGPESRGGVFLADRSFCLPAQCRTDGDCPDGRRCELSRGAGCCATTPFAGWYCRTATDACQADADCPAPADGSRIRCLFSPAAGRWRCEAPPYENCLCE